MKMNEPTKDNKNDGLPDIAQKLRDRKPLVLIPVSIIIATLFTMCFHSKPKVKPQPAFEETYTPQAQNAGEAKVDHPLFIKTPVSAEPKQTSQVTKEVMQAQILLLQEKQKELQQRLTAPLMLVNDKAADKAVDEVSHPARQQSNDPNTQFMNQVSAQNPDTVNATKIESLSFTVIEGTLIHATLESATDSDLPGYLRAIVSETIFSEDGSQALIPPGSILIGQYKSGIAQGQSRIFIVWTRLITPDGVSVNLGSPGVDNLGVAGMGADEIDRHFFQRFGTASLLSMIGAGAANNGVSSSDQANSAAAYRAAVANSFAQSAGQSLQQEAMIAPTLKTYQGKPIIVFVAHDINFAGVIKKLNPKINVF